MDRGFSGGESISNPARPAYCSARVKCQAPVTKNIAGLIAEDMRTFCPGLLSIEPS